MTGVTLEFSQTLVSVTGLRRFLWQARMQGVKPSSANMTRKDNIGLDQPPLLNVKFAGHGGTELVALLLPPTDLISSASL